MGVCEDHKDMVAAIATSDKGDCELCQKLDELERLRSILSKTADGVYIVPGMTLFVVYKGHVQEVASYCLYGDGSFGAEVEVKHPRHPGSVLLGGAWKPEECYSTREAAEAAEERSDSE